MTEEDEDNDGKTVPNSLEGLIARWSVIVGRPAEEMIAERYDRQKYGRHVPREITRRNYEEAIALSQKSDEEIRDRLHRYIDEGATLIMSRVEACRLMSDEEIDAKARRHGDTREAYDAWRRHFTEVFPVKFHQHMEEYKRLPPRDAINLVLLSSGGKLDAHNSSANDSPE